MEQYISKSALVEEIERRIGCFKNERNTLVKASDNNLSLGARIAMCEELIVFIDTLEVIDPYEHCIQYASIESCIKAHAEDYSWNIESELFQQLTPEQQKLWRKEIEQAVISGRYSGLNLAKDPRYKEKCDRRSTENQGMD